MICVEFSTLLARRSMSLGELSFFSSNTEEIQSKRKHADTLADFCEKYCKVKLKDFNRARHILPLDAFWSHNTGKVLKFLLPGIFWRAPRWNKTTEELETQRRRDDMAAAAERLPWHFLWLFSENKNKQR